MISPLPKSGITELPNDIFLLIIAYLSPKDVVTSRQVSRAFYAVFTEADLNRQLLHQHYPRAREVRPCLHKQIPHGVDWSGVFGRVSARYHHLLSGIPTQTERLLLCKSFVAPTWARYYPIAPWQRHLQFEDKIAHFHYPDTLWVYDEGILIFPSFQKQQYILYDLESRVFVPVDINSEIRIVRRIRLKEKVLIVEWCEQEPYHHLNESETVYRHFASAYDLIVDTDSRQWRVVFRWVESQPLS